MPPRVCAGRSLNVVPKVYIKLFKERSKSRNVNHRKSWWKRKAQTKWDNLADSTKCFYMRRQERGFAATGTRCPVGPVWIQKNCGAPHEDPEQITRVRAFYRQVKRNGNCLTKSDLVDTIKCRGAGIAKFKAMKGYKATKTPPIMLKRGKGKKTKPNAYYTAGTQTSSNSSSSIALKRKNGSCLPIPYLPSGEWNPIQIEEDFENAFGLFFDSRGKIFLHYNILIKQMFSYLRKVEKEGKILKSEKRIYNEMKSFWAIVGCKYQAIFKPKNQSPRNDPIFRDVVRILLQAAGESTDLNTIQSFNASVYKRRVERELEETSPLIKVY